MTSGINLLVRRGNPFFTNTLAACTCLHVSMEGICPHLMQVMILFTEQSFHCPDWLIFYRSSYIKAVKLIKFLCWIWKYPSSSHERYIEHLRFLFYAFKESFVFETSRGIIASNCFQSIFSLKFYISIRKNEPQMTYPNPKAYLMATSVHIWLECVIGKDHF